MSAKVKLIDLKKEYQILECQTPEDLSNEVNKHLKTGIWFLVGGPYGLFNSEDLIEIHCQAMVRIGHDRETNNVRRIVRDVKDPD